jgi:hypothetical protein
MSRANGTVYLRVEPAAYFLKDSGELPAIDAEMPKPQVRIWN